MKKKITRIWSIGLVVVLAASLLLSAAPASASTLAWGSETIPTTTGNVLAATTDVSDFAISDDGQTIWVTDTEGNGLYKSIDGGVTFSSKTITDLAAPVLVAMAPDDPDIVAVGGDTTEMYITTNGGTDWGTMGEVVEGSLGTLASMTDIAISQDSSGKHYVAVSGTESAILANVWYFNVGASAPTWKETNSLSDFGDGTPPDTALAVAFSPNFASDKVIAVVTQEDSAGSGDLIRLELFSLSNLAWNETGAAFTDYPVTIVSDDDITAAGASTASISLSPDYLGSDDSLRVAFVGLDIVGGATAIAQDGIYRLKDTSLKAMKIAIDVKSIDYDGTNLVAGSADTNKVYRSADPLDSSPTVSTASALKRPGGDTAVVVAWAGADVYAGTTGTSSSFNISRDNGKSFNGLSLVDDATAALSDVAVSADGSVIYLAYNDDAGTSIWRKASDWERVLAVDTVAGAIVRVAPEDPYAVYVADTGAVKTMYFSSEGGDTKWFLRSSRYNIQDLAVESASVCYVAVDSADTVSTSTNSGFTWASAKDGKLVTGASTWIKSLGEDMLLLGGASGYLSYSADGNDTWTQLKKQINDTTAIAVATASGLSDGDFVYAASTSTGLDVQRWEIGDSTSWKDIISGVITTAAGDLPVSTTMSVYDLSLFDGTLYALASSGTDSGLWRVLSPTDAKSSTTWSYKLTTDADNVALTATATSPQALTATMGSTKLWAVDTGNNKLYSYLDTLADTGPTLLGPADGSTTGINPVSGDAFAVSLSWERLSDASSYDVEVSLDTGFVEDIVNATVASTSGTAAYVATAGTFMPDTTYYWRIRTDSSGPVYSPYSETRSFTIGELPEAQAPVVIQAPGPAPIIEVPPAPAITIEPPQIVLPAPPPAPPDIVIPAAPPPAAPAIPSWAIYAIIIIGAVLVIALIVLIMRTRRAV